MAIIISLMWYHTIIIFLPTLSHNTTIYDKGTTPLQNNVCKLLLIGITYLPIKTQIGE